MSKAKSGFNIVYIIFLCIICIQCNSNNNQKLPEVPLYKPELFDLKQETKFIKKGIIFNSNAILSDYLFDDFNSINATDIQSFFELSPYGYKSFLADYREDNVLVSKLIIDIAVKYKINPLILLTKIQVEMSLVSQKVKPAIEKINHALGCSCADGKKCSSNYKGFKAQLNCAALHLRKFTEEQIKGHTTISGWKVNIEKRTLDNVLIIPKSKATASLYAYTPWVLKGKGGNWLFWNIFYKYMDFIGKQPRLNSGWIGNHCLFDQDCKFEQARCMPHELFPDGFCSSPCQKYCPDPYFPFQIFNTFCINLEFNNLTESFCTIKCDYKNYKTTGCRDGYQCLTKKRNKTSNVMSDVCVPVLYSL